jgi:hypothetical protein
MHVPRCPRPDGSRRAMDREACKFKQQFAGLLIFVKGFKLLQKFYPLVRGGEFILMFQFFDTIQIDGKTLM